MTRHMGLWVILALLAYLTFLILHSYWEYLLFAILFAVLFAGTFRTLSKRMPRSLAALIIVVGTFLLLVVPTIYVVINTVSQAPLAYENAIAAIDKDSVHAILGITGDEARNLTITAGESLRDNVLTNAASYVSRISDMILGLAIMFLVLFFLVRDGDSINTFLIEQFPAKKSYAQSFLTNMRSIILAVVLGQVVTALVQGSLVGLLLWAFGIPNPLFWGVVTAIVSVIPLVGPALVYVPGSIYLFAQERYIASIVVLVCGIAIVSQVDHFIRTAIVSKATRIHPLVAILGVLGGIKLWGLIGFIAGPIVLAACLILYELAAKEARRESA